VATTSRRCRFLQQPQAIRQNFVARLASRSKNRTGNTLVAAQTMLSSPKAAAWLFDFGITLTDNQRPYASTVGFPIDEASSWRLDGCRIAGVAA